MVLDEKQLKYVEVGIFCKDTEVVGLLTSYDLEKNSIYIIPKDIKDAAFVNLNLSNITFIKMVYEERREEYFFKKSVGDQLEATQFLSTILIELTNQDRCSAFGFIDTNTYTDLPDMYLKTRVAKNCTNYTPPSNVYKDTYTHLPTKPYVAPTTSSKITFIKRKSILPKRTELLLLEKKISSNVIHVTLPILAEDNDTQAEFVLFDGEDYLNGAYE